MSRGEERKTDFHCRSATGQLNHLAGTSRPEIQFAVHQCARFSQSPKMSHEKAVKRVVRCLKRTKDQGLILDVGKSKGIECCVGADFAGGCDKHHPDNPRDYLSRAGFVAKCAGCPIAWPSRLQKLLAFSLSESWDTAGLSPDLQYRATEAVAARTGLRHCVCSHCAADLDWD